MAINFLQGQVAVSDPTVGQGGPFASSNIKDVVIKAVKLTSANFSTTNVDTLVAVLAADSTIIGLRLWVKTQLAGGGITAATATLGTSTGAADLHAASALAFGTAGTYTVLPTPLGIMQNYNIPYGQDIRVFVRGTSTTGTPTSGEMYLIIEYVR